MISFEVITLFPNMFSEYLSDSIIGRGVKNNLVDFNIVNLRDYSLNKHKKVDDTTYGGGAGMVLSVEVLYRCIKEKIRKNSKLIFLSPKGKLYNQEKVLSLSNEEHIILVCGKYEGFDSRIFELFDCELLSIGDYIISGGELGALIIIDSVLRYKKEILNEESLLEESYSKELNGMLEYSQYTRPAIFKELSVPEVLLNGNHKEIKKWRKKSSLINTYINRPELLIKAKLDIEDINNLNNFVKETCCDYKQK